MVFVFYQGAYGIIAADVGAVETHNVSYSLTLGPFHSAWRGPMRFIMDLEGETITNIDLHTGMNDRGCADRITKIPLSQAMSLVPRVCGTCGHAHMLAFCQAIEHLNKIDVPMRAQLVRMMVCELERASMHVAGAVALCATIGVDHHAHELTAIQSMVVTLLHELAPHTECIIMPGGLAYNPSTAALATVQTGIAQCNKQLYACIDHIIDDRGVLARTVDVGRISHEAVTQLDIGGFVARASGVRRDLRFDMPYAAYERLDVHRIVQEGGDVYARLVVLLLESHESIKMVEQCLRLLKVGPYEGNLPMLTAGIASGSVEGPRGLITYIINSDGVRITQCEIHVQRQLDRLLTRTLLLNTQLDDFLPIVASTDTCTACAER